MEVAWSLQSIIARTLEHLLSLHLEVCRVYPSGPYTQTWGDELLGEGVGLNWGLGVSHWMELRDLER